MKFGVPWSVKGIRPEARETAKEAARRSGMPLGEWLNSVILQQAEDDDTRSRYRDEEDSYGDDMSSVHERLDQIASRIDKMSRTGPAAYAPKRIRQEPAQPSNDKQIAQLIDRLDRRLEQFVNAPQMMSPRMMAPPLAPAQMPMHQPIYPAMMAPQPVAHQMPPQMAPQPVARQMAPQMAPRPMPPPGLDRAVAEIAARQRALNGQQGLGQQGLGQQSLGQQGRGQPAATAQSAMAQPVIMTQAAPVLMPVPSQDLSGLEDHLRQITDQIEALRHPGVEDAINALRNELGEIGQALNEAMPRQAIETIEKQIQGLSQRIAEERKASRGADVDAGALAGVEHGLAEVRDALRGLTPAENLIGFNDAIAGLAHKIDLIVAQKDPQTIGQLENAINTLREMAAHVASGDAVGRLAAQVQDLADKVDHFGAAAGGSEALNNLEHRISALSDALAERTQNGGSVPPRLEALVESLSDKIEQIQHERGGDVAAGHLEDQIVALVQRLDASDSRLGHLEAIERGLADLLVHIEEMRAGKASGSAELPPAVTELKHDIARTQDALDAVHGTLGLVVDRLASIEKDVRGEHNERRAAADPDTLELTMPVGRIAARAIVDEPPQPTPRIETPEPTQFEIPEPQAVAHIPQPAPQLGMQPPPQAAPQQPMPQPMPAPQAAAPRRMPPAMRQPINPNLPPDQPLEPGSGAPAMRASARIAASEAALGGSRPAASAGPAGKSGFIAAARRAAQSAVESATPRAPRPEPAELNTGYEDEATVKTSLRASVMKKIKSVFIAASLVAIVIGSIQIASNVFDFGGSAKRHAALTQAPEQEVAGELNAADDGGKSAADTGAMFSKNTAIPLSPPVLPGYMSSSQSTGAGTLASKLPSVLYPTGRPEPSLLNPPALNIPARGPDNDITGSIPRSAAKSRASPPQAMPDTDQLPAAIGAAKLRDAAAGGDAGAAYEVAVRFAEGRGVPADPQEAAHWYERAAMKGLAPAQFRYASLLEKGIGVKKNLGQARKLYLAAANKGHAKAMHNLAVLYAEGIDGKPDYATATHWFRKASEHGIADSQYNLGVLYARGLGVEKNVTESYKWFSLAAGQGDKEAAKKRDDVAGQLDAAALAAAQNAIRTFVPEPQPHSATAVPAPNGGWDEDTGTPLPPRLPRSLSALTPGQHSASARR